MWKATACIRLLRWGALSAGRHCVPTAQSSSSYQGARDNPPPPGAAAGPSRTQAALAGEPGASHHLPANQDRVSESRVCRSRAACYQCGHRAGALSTQWGRTRGCAQHGQVGALLEAPRSRQEPRLYFQLRLLGQALHQLSEQPNSRFRELREMPVTARGQAGHPTETPSPGPEPAWPRPTPLRWLRAERGPKSPGHHSLLKTNAFFQSRDEQGPCELSSF